MIYSTVRINRFGGRYEYTASWTGLAANPDRHTFPVVSEIIIFIIHTVYAVQCVIELLLCFQSFGITFFLFDLMSVIGERDTIRYKERYKKKKMEDGGRRGGSKMKMICCKI